jgi:hypothetical protein
MKQFIYGLFSFTTTIYAICFVVFKTQMFELAERQFSIIVLLLGVAVVLMTVSGLLFNNHFLHNAAISSKWYHLIRVAILLTNPISFPLYWLYFFVIKKPDTNDPGFPLARE